MKLIAVLNPGRRYYFFSNWKLQMYTIYFQHSIPLNLYSHAYLQPVLWVKAEINRNCITYRALLLDACSCFDTIFFFKESLICNILSDYETHLPQGWRIFMLFIALKVSAHNLSLILWETECKRVQFTHTPEELQWQCYMPSLYLSRMFVSY